MRLDKAREMTRPQGFLVSWEWRENGLLRSDHTPDTTLDEKPFPTLDEAQGFAGEMARKAPENVVNIKVVRANDFVPVSDGKFRSYP